MNEERVCGLYLGIEVKNGWRKELLEMRFERLGYWMGLLFTYISKVFRKMVGFEVIE